MHEARQLSLNLPPHRNHGLFADHYLDHVLPARVEWARLADEAAPVLEAVRAIFATFVPSTDEAQTENDLVRPVLDALGHTYEVQGRLRVPGRIHKPDYVFYRDTEAKNAQKNTTLDKTLPTLGGLAVGDAKYWGRSLDTTQGGTGEDNRNPAFQIYWYVLHSGVEWGILTNGKLWRLVHRDTADRLDVYYEVDLQELVEDGDVARFLYFFAFFRRAAFSSSTDSEPSAGPLGLAELLRASTDYAHAVSDSLKAQVYDALRHIAQGFLDYTPNGLQPAPETLREIYDNALILLYRLIFILYAEARELLPVRVSDQYRDTYSLQAITHAIARDVTAGRHLLPTSARIWPQLKELFGFIDRGEPPLQIATFNGGLFDPEKHPFLEQYAVGDAHLQQAIDQLARVRGQFIDYRDLTVRHMGTIYEGLLEYHLQPLSASEAGWTVDLVNDKGERKATGSYYTPDYVVKFIVERTVGPALCEAVAGKATDAEKLQAVLEVNVLDPAMGSGHFLVEATEYIARFLVDQDVVPEGKTPEEADLAFWKRRVVQSCIYGVDLNPLAVELAKLSLWLITVAKDRPLSFLDHHLRPGNSLVGARLAALQAHSGAAGGKKAKKAKAVPDGQAALFTEAEFTQRMAVAVGSMWLIEENDAASVDQVKAQERTYAEIRRQLIGKYGRLADLLTARHFGVEVPADLWTATVDFVMGRALGAPAAIQELVARAAEVARRERFFHWELEFPEVFFDRHGRPLGDEGGFEAVIGNPPYVDQRRIGWYKSYFAAEYPEVYHGVADLCIYFCAQGLRQTRRAGELSYIMSGQFRKLDYGAPLREYLGSEATIQQIVDFGDEQVFQGAVTYPLIITVRRIVPSDHSQFVLSPVCVTRGDESGDRSQPQPHGSKPWVFVAPSLQHIIDGWEASRPLGSIISECIYRGVTTGANEVFIIDGCEQQALITADPKSSELVKPLVLGEDLVPWLHVQDDRWLIFTRRGVAIDHYPAIKAYLTRYKERLEPQPPDWSSTSKWPGRKAGAYQWYEIQDSVAYFHVFERLRIFSNKVTSRPCYSLAEVELYAGNTAYAIPVPDIHTGWYILGLLNSRVHEFYSRNVFAPKANGFYEVQPDKLGDFPIPDASSADRDAIGTLAMTITEHARARYALHEKVRRRLHADLGTPGTSLNQKLTAWWVLDFPALRAEVKKVFKHDIPVADRDDWDAYHAAQRAEHARLTTEIIRLETDLNTRVYTLFGLTADEIAIIEASTKYRYGEV